MANVVLLGFPTVTVSGAVPVSSTEKLFDWLSAVLPKVIVVKARLVAEIFISLSGGVAVPVNLTTCLPVPASSVIVSVAVTFVPFGVCALVGLNVTEIVQVAGFAGSWPTQF